MKKMIALALSLIMVLSMFGCSGEPANENYDGNDDKAPAQSSAGEEEKESTENKKEEITPDSWGVADRFNAENEKPTEVFSINFPHFGGATVGYGLGGNQGDGTTVYVFGQNEKSPKIEKLSELLPAYFEQIEYTLGKVYGLRGDNYKFTLNDHEPVSVGEYDMHIFEGEFSFEYEGNPRNHQFVVCATTLKSNGAYVYWFVHNTSASQKCEELMKENALNMAKTLREED